ncbi:ThiF family adenylyltransferase [Leucobacter allii]|uniref:ThiF family adenylyltransferase n=1 Tax=Leucobacter allii TaxID=2932247 RepID=UPI001FD029F2|nr:ThiF family adenylyltransferase [Leucobacter allii]UOR02733.1 ThiF family adenylyltransferase [Leucobacter allii]
MRSTDGGGPAAEPIGTGRDASAPGPAGRPAAPAPLVAPVAELSAAARGRARRQLALPGFGEEAQRRLAGARVLVIGAGGLGCASVPFLAGAGVGRIGIVDDDTVELSNLHRQTTHRTADLGRPKVDALAETVAALDPGIRVDRHRLRLTSGNARELLAGYDLVLDGSDNFPTRYLANDAAELTGIPLVWGAILQYSGQLGVAWHAHGAGYRDLFPRPPAPGSVLDCASGGVLPGLCGTIGSLMATEALKLITGLGEPLIGRVLLYDALAARTRELRVRPDPRAERVTGLVDYAAFCGVGPEARPAGRASALTADELAARLRAGDPVRLIDVRTAEEFAERRLRGAERIPVERIEADGAPEHLAGEFVVAYCERDPRSVRAAAALAADGVDVAYLEGGIAAFAPAAPELVERGGDGAAQ